MSEGWKKIDLEGGGLQTLQFHYLQAQRKLGTAYGLWLLFPLGLHRAYLKAPAFWAYPLFTLAILAPLYFHFTLVGAALAGGLIAAALYDLFRLPAMVSDFNKNLKKTLWLSKRVPAPPKDYQGRYTDHNDELRQYIEDKESEKAGHPPAAAENPSRYGRGKRAPSFAEQERLLAELAKMKKENKKNN